MPCHVRSASAPQKRRLQSLTLRPPKVVALFNLSDDREREMRAIIERFHTGRWPLFRCHAMRRVGSVVYEVVRWNPSRQRRPYTYSVVTWELTAIALRWREYATLEAAHEAFAAIVGKVPPVNPAASVAALAAR